MDKKDIAIVTLVVVVAIFVGSRLGQKQRIITGSVEQGSEYKSTTTFAGIVSPLLIASGNGTLGNVVITKTGAGLMACYDATTTSVLKRATSKPTTTRTLFAFGASPTVGTYIYDLSFYDGLVCDLPETSASTTITYRWQ